MPISLSEVPYEKADLSGILKKELIAMVERQVEKWPYLGGFDPKAKATTASRLRAVLLDPKNGFTHAVRVTLPSPPPDISLDGDNIPDGDHVGCAPGEWRADLGDLLGELQASNSAVTGPVKLSYRDPENVEYRVCFVKVADDALLEEAQPFPALVTISATKCLEIFIEHAEDVYFHAEPRIGLYHRTSQPEALGQFHVQDGNAKPLEIARQRQQAATTPNNHVDTNGDIQWLTEQIKTLEGYADFQDNRRRVQNNSGVVASWKFMDNVATTYFGQPSHIVITNSSKGREKKKIQKQSIQKALGVGSTTLNQAQVAIHILRCFGDGGTSPAQDVIDHVSLEEDDPKGAKALYPFLVEWERRHKP
ncbi:hypothetical protein C8J57DRAFT_1250273 [Mycena rebaudengoi]|nr:hypothetical protein C8J57DRAFT_1250273 [Mycena rebaudengoi]